MRRCAAALVAYCNWGLGVALGPMIAIHFARQAELKGLPVDFLFLQAILAGARLDLAVRALGERAAPGRHPGPLPRRGDRDPAARHHDLGAGDAGARSGLPGGDDGGRVSTDAQEAAPAVGVPGVRGAGDGVAGRNAGRRRRPPSGGGPGASPRDQPADAAAAPDRARRLALPSLLRQRPEPRHQRGHHHPAARGVRAARERRALHRGAPGSDLGAAGRSWSCTTSTPASPA